MCKAHQFFLTRSFFQGAFTLSVVCCAVAAFIHQAKLLTHPDDYLALAERLNPHTVIGGVARLAYRSFKFAFILYTIALGEMVNVFNAETIPALKRQP